ASPRPARGVRALRSRGDPRGRGRACARRPRRHAVAKAARRPQGAPRRDRGERTMKGLQCPAELELSRALQSGPAPELESHLAACAACRAAWDMFELVIGLARELPLEVPGAAHRDEVRAALLAAAESGEAPGLLR